MVDGLREWSALHLRRWTLACDDLAGGTALTQPPSSASSSTLPSPTIASVGSSAGSTFAVSGAAQFHRQLSTLRVAEFVDLTCRVLALDNDKRQLLVWDGTDVQEEAHIVWSNKQQHTP